ncbi:adenylate cyclase [Spathaspora passalidarum NRRL Y-27907]|uniref:Adenylate cyclase n=1 Tax=Spathaspora passalidarum (strain NRRL Y-27907 / 11-Y1) TaxID=619300 RepID=G3AUZ0_SPAPN|nr:adenylate cyclase [Spathaspora passalidarum NRRL Y-27907]EGW29847.1 adenylate cyclase [Spathaspora passalidarum NRRL Y-27907]
MSFLKRDKSKSNLKLQPLTASTSHKNNKQPPPADTGDHGHTPRHDYDCSPKSSVVSLPGLHHESIHTPTNLKENYSGFHANKRPKGIANVPPLAHPIKPRFKKKGSSLLNKLIYSRRDGDGEEQDQPGRATSLDSSMAGSTGSTHQRKSASSASSQTSKHKFRLPSLTLDHHHKQHQGSITSKSIDAETKLLPTEFDLNLDEMHGIIKSPEEVSLQLQQPIPPISLAASTASGAALGASAAAASAFASASGSAAAKTTPGWQAPDSWGVRIETKVDPNAGVAGTIPNLDEVIGLTETDEEEEKSSEEAEELPPHPHLPTLYGTKQLHQTIITPADKNLTKGPSHIIRVFKEDNTFTTVLCPLETTTAELLSIVQRKFFLDYTSNYQISVYIGNNVKVLEQFEKPLKIQMGLLLLSGYTEEDNLRIIGREDLSFVCKFVVENIYLRSLTHDEEASLSRNYVEVNMQGLNLKNIPIIFHQHTYEIEKLNVADNPSIYIPLDFIQSCNNLTMIDFSRNGASKFPLNFLEAKRLTHLNMEKNFLDELPSRINHLKNLTHVKLNSNQLSSLPKSFGKLRNLQVLNLSSNYFHNYPECISELTCLVELDLSYNDLLSLPESIGKLIHLQKLNVASNKLSKSLPHYLLNLTELKRLDIRFNQITSVDIVGLLPNLEVAYATKNNISTFNDQANSLRLLHFDKNPITEINFSQRMDMLNILDLSKAKITSIAPEFIRKIPNIEKLVLDKNHLVTLPNNIDQLTKLAFLSIFGNQLQSLPVEICHLKSLQYLDLHSNNLQSLPEEIWHLKSLSVLNVSSNILTSFPKPPLAIAKRVKPSSLVDSLMMLTMSDNRLSDDCFEPISFLISLKSLNLTYNDLLEIPEGALRRLTKLNELYLSGNGLTTLPSEDLESLKSLKLLYVNGNKLVTLPAEISKLTNLQHLDVGSNQLKYNISNWPYDWSWHWNKNLKYLNFSGNKRFEIKQSHIKNPETGEDFDSLLVLKQLKVLGLIDVTLTTTSVPDQSVDIRIRTTTSELENVGYGVADTMGMRDNVSCRDLFIQKFRGNENELLICSFDGKCGATNQGHRLSTLCKNILVGMFTDELNKGKGETDEEIYTALRRTFLNLNKEINGILSAKQNNSFTPTSKQPKELQDLSLIYDLKAGVSITVVYIKDKKIYTANVGDIEALLCRSNGDHVLLTNKHDPTNRDEFERIRASGGYVSGDGYLDGELTISRGAGFFNFLPHTHSGPSINDISLASNDEVLIMATRMLWDYITFELAVDIIRSEKDDPMIAAQKLRDYAICYGATDKIAVIIVTFGERKKRGSNILLYNNLGHEADYFGYKKKRVAGAAQDSTLRRLDDEIEPPVGELALIFTDIKNSTLLWDSYPAPMRSAIKTHNSIMRRQLRLVGGYEVKTEGDSFMVAFPSPTSALLWCFNVQQNLLTADWPSEILETDQCCEVTDSEGNIIYRGLSVRMGIHWGSPDCERDVVTQRMDYYGPMVNRTSRVSAVADGGQICVTSDFLDEMNQLYGIHEKIVSGEKTFEEAYQGNVRAGEIIEKEIKGIEENGCHYFELGERKLKGLETPELITLAYTDKLKLRYEIFKKRLGREIDKAHSTRVVGTLPVEIIYGLRTVSLRLENVCSAINGGTYLNEEFEQHSSGMISQKMKTTFKEVDLIALLNHIVTRIESCSSMLYLRQQMSIASGNDGFIDIFNSVPIGNIMDELNQIVEQFNIYKKTIE